MRGLQTSDLFSAIRVLTKIGVREEIKAIAKQAEENKGNINQFDLGFDLMLGIIEKAAEQKAEIEIYRFIADLFDCAPDEVRTMHPVKMFNKLLEVANVEEWKDFFGYVRRLIMKK